MSSRMKKLKYPTHVHAGADFPDDCWTKVAREIVDWDKQDIEALLTSLKKGGRLEDACAEKAVRAGLAVTIGVVGESASKAILKKEVAEALNHPWFRKTLEINLLGGE